MVSARKIFQLAFCFFLAGVMTVSASVTAPSITTEKITLDNGMTALVSEMPGQEVVSLYALVKAGSATEGDVLGSGISHFLEHMLFKQTETRGVGEISRAIQAVGGSVNASTGLDYTTFKVTVPVEAFDTGLDVLSDMLMHSIFTPEEFAKEQQVILKEMNMVDDQPGRVVMENTFKTVYLSHPYRHPVIGYRSLFEQITQEQLFDYYKKHYVPNNIVFSVAGAVQASDVFPKIRDAFAGFERGAEVSRVLAKEPEQITPRFNKTEYPTKVAHLVVAYPTISLLDSDLFALDVLAKILGGGRTSRLYQEIYDRQKLVYGISASSYTPVDPGMLMINAVLDEKNISAVRQKMGDIIADIQQKGVKSAELEKVKRQVVSEFIMGYQTSEAVAYSRAVDEAYAGDYLFSDRYVEGINKVTDADVTRVAKKYLMPSKESVVILSPQNDAENSLSPNTAVTAAADIQKIILGNGVRILLRRDSTFPIINFHLVSNGGLRYETEETMGISQMFASSWTKGTASRSAGQIHGLVESRGMALGSYAGRNSVGLTLNVLADDKDAAVELLYDIVSKPEFPSTEIEKIRKDMLSNLENEKDNVFHYGQKELKKLLFKAHPLRFNENGTPESLQAITREELIDYYDRVVRSDNIVLAVYGDFETNDMLSLLHGTFGKLKQQTFEPSKVSAVPLQGQQVHVDHLPKEQALILYGFQAVDFYDPNRDAVDLLTNILGASFSGRMFADIRDKEAKAYTLGGQFVPSTDTGWIYFYISTTPEYVDAVQELMKKEILAVQTDLIPEQELKDMKDYLIGNQKIDLQTNGDLAFTTSLDEVYGLGYDRYKDYDARVNAVTAEAVRNAARKYLDLNKAAIVIITPSGEDALAGGND